MTELWNLHAHPIRPVPCKECAHLRECENPDLQPYYMACGWWDQPLPLASPTFTPVRDDVIVARKRVFGPHSSEPLETCPVFKPATAPEASPFVAPEAPSDE
jgi:hypothetical protein